MAVVTEPSAPPARPVDVDTAFWLWVVALPLMVAGYVIDLLAADSRPDGLVIAISLVFVAVATELTATLLLAPTGTRTLAMGFWSLSSELNYAGAAPYALVMVLLAMPVTMVLFRQSTKAASI